MTGYPKVRATRLLLAALLPASLGASAHTGRDGNRELGCSTFLDKRAGDVCRAVESEMEWTARGHAVLAPGYKVTTRTLERVYCGLHLTRDDAPMLRGFEQMSTDNRLRLAAHDLLQMLGLGLDPNDSSSLNPSHPQFVLRHGCPPAG